jgi:sRNA-binding carbon storage regulator CsrA
MLVIARKRHQAVTIDGNIRVEVLRLTGGLARLRFVAPRRITIERGVTGPGGQSAPEAVNGGIDAAGMGVVDLTLGDQQIITVRSDVHLGLVDIDSTRAVLFIDAPNGVPVTVESAERSRTPRLPTEGHEEAVQALLPFPPPAEVPPVENLRCDSRNAAGAPPSKDPPTPIIPFPGVGPEPEGGV